MTTLRQRRIAGAVFFFISGFGYASWASRIPSVQQKLHLNEAQLGSILFAMPVGLMLTMPVTGRLLARFNSRRILLAGVLLFNVMLAIAGFTRFGWELSLVLFCFGCARNLFNISLNAQAVSLQALYDRSIMTTFHGIWSLAGFAGAAVGYGMVALNVPAGWHLFAVSALTSMGAAGAFPRLLVDKPAEAGPVPGRPTPSPAERRPIFALPDKHLLNFSFICFASMACENTMYDWSGIFFRKAVLAPKAEATAAFAVYMIAMTTGRFAGDRIVGRFGIKRLLRASGILIASGLFLAAALPYALSAGFGFILVGLGVSCIVPLVFSMAGQSKTMSSGPALAAISTVGYLGFLVIPPFVGFVAQASNLRWSFGLVGLLGLVIVRMVSSV